MKRIRIDKRRIRRERSWPEDMPIDPRDPDVVRAKALARARSEGQARQPKVLACFIPFGHGGGGGAAVEGAGLAAPAAARPVRPGGLRAIG
jgi:hypothetical protein